MVPDKAGNTAIKTVYFTVNAGSPKIDIDKKQDQAILGDVFDLAVKATNPAEISGSTIKMQIDKNFPVESVQFANGFNGSTYSYDAETGSLTLNLVNSGETAATADAATIHIKIPPFTNEGSKLTYGIDEANLSYHAPQDNSFVTTYSMLPANVDVKGAFNVTAEPILIGKPAVITVKNSNNEFISDAEVYANIDGSTNPILLGKTDSNGTLRVDSITNEVKRVALYAVKDGKYSFPMNTQTYPSLLGLTEIKNIISTPTSNPQEMSFTWESSPLAKDNTVIQFARQKDYDKKGERAFRTVNGSSSNQVFSSDPDITKNGIVRVNHVTLTDLKHDTTYVYRVGDGENWSSPQEFTTLDKK
jgi:hypothetical protein